MAGAALAVLRLVTILVFSPTAVKNGANNSFYSSSSASASASAVDPASFATLALVDPYLIGGFRNEHMRFVALVNHAVATNATNLLLPSLRWAGKAGEVGFEGAVSHESLFDVDWWNAHRQQEGEEGNATGGQNNNVRLPKLVRYSDIYHSCWNNATGLFGSLDAAHIKSPSFKLRKQDLMAQVTHCTEPRGYGSGRGAGRLWNAYIEMGKGNRGGVQRHPVEVQVLRALRPSRPLQDIVDSFLGRGSTGTSSTSSNGTDSTLLLAVHPRVEGDMLGHACAKTMVKNLTLLVTMMEASDLLNVNQQLEEGRGSDDGNDRRNRPRYHKVFLAIGRSGMKVWPGAGYAALLAENLVTLDRIANQGLWNGTVPVLESGENSVSSSGISKSSGGIHSSTSSSVSVVSTGGKSRNTTANHTDTNIAEGGVVPDHAKPLGGAIVDFFIAVGADAFLGTYGSSYSNDVWTARYYLGKGDSNFVHGIQGIGRVPNDGLPPQWKLCK